VPDPATESEKCPPIATSVSASGCVVMTGASTVAPLLLDELELLLLELDDELLEELELEELEVVVPLELVTPELELDELELLLELLDELELEELELEELDELLELPASVMTALPLIT